MTQEERKNNISNREKIVKRIVSEKGESAIPILIKLLEDESNEVREIAAQALQNFGDVAASYLMDYLRKKLDEEEPFNDISLLYVADILGELRHKESIPLLYQLLEYYDDEPYQLIIYEALAKLGEGEKLIELLIYLLKEDAFKEELKDQVLMTLAYTKSEKALKILIDEWYKRERDFETRSLILNAIKILLIERPEFTKILSRDKNTEKILDELRFY